MKSFTLIIIIILTFFTCEHSFAQVDTSQVEHPPNGHNSPYRIDFTDLITHAQYYNGQQLEVIGYLNLKFEVDALWLSKAYYHARNWKKAIPLNLSEVKHPRRFNHRYVIIEAVFHRFDRELGLSAFELNVERLKRYRGKMTSQ